MDSIFSRSQNIQACIVSFFENPGSVLPRDTQLAAVHTVNCLLSMRNRDLRPRKTD